MPLLHGHTTVALALCIAETNCHLITAMTHLRLGWMVRNWMSLS
jgi:hypothetical protein